MIPALTVRQPWAFGIVHGKTVENRSRAIKYRGPLWLHAGARSRWDPAGGESPLIRHAWTTFRAGLPESDVVLGRRTTLMPFGAIVALVDLVGCHPDNECERPDGERPAFCSPWAAQWQWHWQLANIRVLDHPVIVRGALGLWRLPADVDEACRKQLPELEAA